MTAKNKPLPGQNAPQSGFLAVLRGPLARGSREGVLIACGLFAVYLLLSLISYDPFDPGWSYSGSVVDIANYGGSVGAWIADFSLHFFGIFAYPFPFIVGYWGWFVYRIETMDNNESIDGYYLTIRLCGLFIATIAGCGLATLYFHPGTMPDGAGGIIGSVVVDQSQAALGRIGSLLGLLGLFLIGSILFTGIPWLEAIVRAGQCALRLSGGCLKLAYALFQSLQRLLSRPQEPKPTSPPGRIDPVITTPAPQPPQPLRISLPEIEATTSGEGGLPSLSLLDPMPASHGRVLKEVLEATSKEVELKLAEFNIEVQVVAVHPGPVVTRYELQPSPGLKVSRITSLAKDLARSLSTTSVRIAEIIPGKTTIGLEIPNKKRDLVGLSELLESTAYKAKPSPLTLVLGKDIAGDPVVADLASMPHLLVAGTTGSGKSVAINAMVLSLLYKAEADDVRMIMIDPKMLELSAYDGIAHLLAPVVTDMKQAGNALCWCVAEMERRYRLMSTLGVRSIAGYNAKVREAAKTTEPLRDPLFIPIGDSIAPELQKLPFIVVIIDEFADLMMITGKKVEELIVRLAQKARAAGIHLLLATQRPSVDVITGLIKANIPSRIAFQVSSKVDSRTILDQGGAESLLGQGDMLFLGPGTSAVVRVHGAFVADHEVHKVVSSLKQEQDPGYLNGILNGSALLESDNQATVATAADEDYDQLYDQAVYIVTETRKASISGVQRRLKIGYNRAARMLEKMEADGVVSALASNGNREVLAPPPPD